MKRFFSINFLFLCLSLHAAPPGEWNLNLWSCFGYSHYKAQTGNLDISFPYRLISPSSNLITNKTFTSQNADLVGRGKWVYPSVGLEVGKGNLSIEGQMGWYIRSWSDNLYGGINYRFNLKRFHAKLKPLVLGAVTVPSKKMVEGGASFPIKLSLGIFYFQPIWNLGTIDVSDHQFEALSYTMQSRDSTSLGNSGNVTVYFHQNIVALKPAISIGFQPENYRLVLNFTASPLIILSEVGGLRFYLRNNGNIDWAPRNGIDPDAVIPLDEFGLSAKFNGEELSDSPFHLKGWMFTLKVGVRLF